MKAPRIFGREPAVFVGIIQAAIVLLGNQLFGWTEDQVVAVSLVVVIVGDGFVAWVTHDTLLGVGIGLVKALVVAATSFGAVIPPDLAPQLIALTTALAGFFQHTQTFPTYDPPKAAPGATPVSEVGAR